MLNGRKTIGIILFDITGYYQQQLVHTLSKNASKRGYNLLTFSAFTIYGSDTKNAAGEYNILHLIPYEQLDALIVCHDTFNSNDAVETQMQFLLLYATFMMFITLTALPLCPDHTTIRMQFSA